ncbi:MAG TPA: holo-ACP synthase [Zoogloea sp.]|uniref:holo-ACP synthase n=1 Tax=Zoogloea sp. TaxID=49181 RepID=UPI002BB37613|nr:holo-ACP synthase [Zoogloea sp.]HMV62522.1 holo-ACP synthase [Rhodocyclaceae bacterium]HMW50578.1 holo-ACP synthase [Rhodocyclaceae bacterium]HMY48486.1 holo-ACP synthase [Rhodocyclaceae bacterium]HMZ74769.1 holo-ACP synthase [Rhodocyclaceae bacterium]HNA69008.1 holo-ACP synthase [Rhodocyclaceae bacterium]
MIHGIGTDIVRVARLDEALARHGARFAERILAEPERVAWQAARQPARHLAKRFAAKEAFGKALGTGVAAPATLHAVRVGHDPLGKPVFEYAPALAAYLAERGLVAHLSLSDEADYVLAFAVIEQP